MVRSQQQTRGNSLTSTLLKPLLILLQHLLLLYSYCTTITTTTATTTIEATTLTPTTSTATINTATVLLLLLLLLPLLLLLLPLLLLPQYTITGITTMTLQDAHRDRGGGERRAAE